MRDAVSLYAVQHLLKVEFGHDNHGRLVSLLASGVDRLMNGSAYPNEEIEVKHDNKTIDV